MAGCGRVGCVVTTVADSVRRAEAANCRLRPVSQSFSQNSFHLRQGGYVFVGVRLLLRITQKTILKRCYKIRWKVARWLRKKPLDFGDNPGSRYVSFFGVMV